MAGNGTRLTVLLAVVKAAIDQWVAAAGISLGELFKCVLVAGICCKSQSLRAVLEDIGKRARHTLPLQLVLKIGGT